MPTVGKLILLGPLPEPSNPAIGYTSAELFRIPGFQDMLVELFKFPVDLPTTQWGIECNDPMGIPYVYLEYIPIELNGEKKVVEAVDLFPDQDQIVKELDASLHNSPQQNQ